MEALTLVQTHKIRRMPVILVHEPFWRGMLGLDPRHPGGREDDRSRGREPDPGDRRAGSVVKAIFEHYEKRGFEPSATEREAQLNL